LRGKFADSNCTGGRMRRMTVYLRVVLNMKLTLFILK
jgi:hypothetical protein